MIEIAAPLPGSRHPCLSRRQLGLNKIVQVASENTQAQDGIRLAWKVLVVVVSQSFQEVVKAPSVIMMGFRSSATVDVEHDAL